METKVDTITDTFIPVPRRGVGNNSMHCTHMMNHPTLLATLEAMVSPTTVVPSSGREASKVQSSRANMVANMQQVWDHLRPNLSIRNCPTNTDGISVRAMRLKLRNM